MPRQDRSGSRGQRAGSGNALTRAARRVPRQRKQNNLLSAVALVVALGTTFLVSVILVATIGFGVGGDLYSYLTRDLPPADEVFSKAQFQSVLIYDRKGRLLYEMVDPQGGRRTVVQLSDMPPALLDATLSTEDPRFYSNPGVDPVSIARALLQDVLHHQVESGASTITQQLVRNVVMTPEERQSQSLSRKVEEAILAIRVTQRYSKDEILERYLNEIPYGNQAYGVEAASETYFDKPGSPAHPRRSRADRRFASGAFRLRSLSGSPGCQSAPARGAYLMVKHGYITQDQADARRRSR